MTMTSLGKITNPKVSLFYENDIPFLSLEFDTEVADTKGFKGKANIVIHKIYLNNISLNTEMKEEKFSPYLPPLKITTNQKISFDLGVSVNNSTYVVNIDEMPKEDIKPIDRQKHVGREVCIIENHENGGYRSNNIKYMSKAYNRKVKLIHNIAEEKECDIFITDFFLPEFKDLNNDYIYNGYLKVMRDDFRFVE